MIYLALYIIIAFMAPCLLLKEVSFAMGPPNAFPQFLDYLVEVGMVIDLGESLRVTSIEHQGCLPYVWK